MAYTVQYNAQAVAELKKLPPKLGKRIVNKINWLAENFDTKTQSRKEHN